MLGSLLAKLGLDLLFGRIRERLTRVPWQVWAAIAGMLLIAGGVWLHQRAVNNLHDAAYAAGRADEKKALVDALAKANADARDWRDKYDAKARALTAKIGEFNALEARNIAAHADDLRLYGPGKAATCPGFGGSTGPAIGAGGHDAAGRSGNASLAPVPAEQTLAIVPWGDLVQYGENSDLNRAEVLTWRQWYAAHAELLRKAKAELPEGSPSP